MDGDGRRRVILGGTLLLLVLSAALAFAFQGSRGLYETTEGRYAESAREMLETGDWLVPRLDYEAHWSKPPLTYWALAGGLALLGENEWGVRLGPALAYLVLIAAVHGLGTAMWGRTTGLIAALVYATSPLAVVASNSVSTDPFLAMWEALTALAYWRALRWSAVGGEDARSSSKRWILLLWLFSGLSFLTKGPPGLLTLLVIFIYHGWRTATHREAPALTSVLGIPVFALVAFGWFIIVGALNQGLISQLIREEVVGRIADPSFNRNPEWYGPLVILLLPIALGVGPWVAYWPSAWRRVRAWSGWRGRWREMLAREAVLFCLLWAVVPLAVLFTSRSRLPLYVLPFLPAVALLTGRAVALRVESTGRTRGALAFVLATAVLMLAVKGVSSHVESRSDMRPVYELVEASGCGSGPVYAYGLKSEYGLMFYLHGEMIRVSPDPVRSYAAMGAAGLVDDVTARLNDSDGADAGPPCVVTKRNERELPEALSAAGIAFARREAGRYAVLAFGPPPSSPSGSGP
jgi:4-amino-4-deoxy-L-arabinose transferase-like glycosyltransferase